MPPLLRAAAVAACLLLAGCGALPDDGQQAAPVAAPGEACAPVQHPPLQAGSHLIGEAEPPVPYSSTPPTSGWHASGALDVGVRGADDPLSEPEQVSVLEAGGAVVSHRDLPDADRAALEALVADRYAGRVAVTPYDALEPGQVALTAWGTLQRCDGLDPAAVEAFLDEHVGEDVTPGH